MRRSKAPSMLKKAKRLCYLNDNMNDSVVEHQGSDPEDGQYEWGSRNYNGAIKPNKYENKRVFNIVWRDISSKKHKTWKGDGTLEVNICTIKAILKDETGKYLGCSTKFNINDLAPDYQMVIGGKEIEIQNEIMDEDELHEVRKRQVQNRNWGDEEWISPKDLAEEEKKPKGGFKFKPILVLKPPQVSSNVELNFERNDSLGPSSSNNCLLEPKSVITTTSVNNRKYKEFICFVRPSELQQFLFQKSLEYYSLIKPSLSLEKLQSLDFVHVLQLICNHPSFINHKTTTNELIQHLIPSLPDWSEMGPFDSGKLEFVQYFLTDITKKSSQSCIIFAKSPNALNMLQGLFDFMNINCLRLTTFLSEETKSQIITEFFSTEKDICQVLLVNNIEVLNSFNFPNHCIKLIVFEESSKNKNILNTLEKDRDIAVYYLVTAFSIEELLLLDTYENNEKQNLLELFDELLNLSNTDNDICYIHSKIECNCFENHQYTNDNHTFIKNWHHFKNPFDDKLLEMSSLSNSAENIVTIFCRNFH